MLVFVVLLLWWQSALLVEARLLGAAVKKQQTRDLISHHSHPSLTVSSSPPLPESTSTITATEENDLDPQQVIHILTEQHEHQQQQQQQQQGKHLASETEPQEHENNKKEEPLEALHQQPQEQPQERFSFHNNSSSSLSSSFRVLSTDNVNGNNLDTLPPDCVRQQVLETDTIRQSVTPTAGIVFYMGSKLKAITIDGIELSIRSVTAANDWRVQVYVSEEPYDEDDFDFSLFRQIADTTLLKHPTDETALIPAHALQALEMARLQRLAVYIRTASPLLEYTLDAFLKTKEQAPDLSDNRLGMFVGSTIPLELSQAQTLNAIPTHLDKTTASMFSGKLHYRFARDNCDQDTAHRNVETVAEWAFVLNDTIAALDYRNMEDAINAVWDDVMTQDATLRNYGVTANLRMKDSSKAFYQPYVGQCVDSTWDTCHSAIVRMTLQHTSAITEGQLYTQLYKYATNGFAPAVSRILPPHADHHYLGYSTAAGKFYLTLSGVPPHTKLDDVQQAFLASEMQSFWNRHLPPQLGQVFGLQVENQLFVEPVNGQHKLQIMGVVTGGYVAVANYNQVFTQALDTLVQDQQDDFLMYLKYNVHLPGNSVGDDGGTMAQDERYTFFDNVYGLESFVDPEYSGWTDLTDSTTDGGHVPPYQPNIEGGGNSNTDNNNGNNNGDKTKDNNTSSGGAQLEAWMIVVAVGAVVALGAVALVAGVYWWLRKKKSKAQKQKKLAEEEEQLRRQAEFENAYLQDPAAFPAMDYVPHPDEMAMYAQGSGMSAPVAVDANGNPMYPPPGYYDQEFMDEMAALEVERKAALAKERRAANKRHERQRKKMAKEAQQSNKDKKKTGSGNSNSGTDSPPNGASGVSRGSTAETSVASSLWNDEPSASDSRTTTPTSFLHAPRSAFAAGLPPSAAVNRRGSAYAESELAAMQQMASPVRQPRYLPANPRSPNPYALSPNPRFISPNPHSFSPNPHGPHGVVMPPPLHQATAAGHMHPHPPHFPPPPPPPHMGMPARRGSAMALATPAQAPLVPSGPPLRRGSAIGLVAHPRPAAGLSHHPELGPHHHAPGQHAPRRGSFTGVIHAPHQQGIGPHHHAPGQHAPRRGSFTGAPPPPQFLQGPPLQQPHPAPLRRVQSAGHVPPSSGRNLPASSGHKLPASPKQLSGQKPTVPLSAASAGTKNKKAVPPPPPLIVVPSPQNSSRQVDPLNSDNNETEEAPMSPLGSPVRAARNPDNRRGSLVAAAGWSRGPTPDQQIQQYLLQEETPQPLAGVQSTEGSKLSKTSKTSKEPSPSSSEQSKNNNNQESLPPAEAPAAKTGPSRGPVLGRSGETTAAPVAARRRKIPSSRMGAGGGLDLSNHSAHSAYSARSGGLDLSNHSAHSAYSAYSAGHRDVSESSLSLGAAAMSPSAISPHPSGLNAMSADSYSNLMHRMMYGSQSSLGAAQPQQPQPPQSLLESPGARSRRSFVSPSPRHMAGSGRRLDTTTSGKSAPTAAPAPHKPAPVAPPSRKMSTGPPMDPQAAAEFWSRRQSAGYSMTTPQTPVQLNRGGINPTLPQHQRRPSAVPPPPMSASRKGSMHNMNNYRRGSNLGPGGLRKGSMAGAVQASLTTGKPKLERGEMMRMITTQLFRLLPPTDEYQAVDKADLVEHIIQVGAVDLVVPYKLSTLRAMSAVQLRKTLVAAGVKFDARFVVEKEDMIRVFHASGKLRVVPEEA